MISTAKEARWGSVAQGATKKPGADTDTQGSRITN